MWWQLALATVVTLGFAGARQLDLWGDDGAIGQGPGRPCDLPARVCDPRVQRCDWMMEMPGEGVGFEDHQRDSHPGMRALVSWIRRDLAMLVQYAAAKVACKARSWSTGTGGPIVVADMSAYDGSIPGELLGRRHHPLGSHTNGRDLDIAYYQRGTYDNAVRPICRYRDREGVDQMRCLARPTQLDAWRTALFFGALLEEPRIRVIGIDGKAARDILAAFDRLCATSWIEPAACAQRGKIVYETRDRGLAWFRGHHDHFHVSLRRE